MATSEKTEDELLNLDNETETADTSENLVIDSTAEERLLGTNDSDVESLPDVELESQEEMDVSQSSQSDTPLKEIVSQTEINGTTNNNGKTEKEFSSAEVAVNSNEESVQNSSNQPNKTEDSDEDIVEILVVKNTNNINAGVPKPIVHDSSEWNAERLRRAKEEERRRLLQTEKVSEFNFRSNRLQNQRKRTRYNVDGRPVIFADDFSFCDCLMPQCPGCHYPCKSCGDARCGHECRVNRKYIYEFIDIEGRGVTLKPPKSS